jgi:hypothetical protein
MVMVLAGAGRSRSLSDVIADAKAKREHAAGAGGGEVALRDVKVTANSTSSWDMGVASSADISEA